MLSVKSAVFGGLQNNCYLITDKDTNKSALVDCTEFSDRMLDFIGNADLEYILLTHGHFDHIGGVSEISERFNAKVVISSIDAPMLSSSKLSLAAFCGAVHNNSSADITVEDNDVIELGNSEIYVISTPGHTSGSVCYMCDDNLFTGDTMFFCSCGKTDFPTGSPVDMQKSLNKLASLNGDYKIFAGHDRQSTLNFERKNNPYISRK